MIAKGLQVAGICLASVGVGVFLWPAGLICFGIGLVVIGATEERG